MPWKIWVALWTMALPTLALADEGFWRPSQRPSVNGPAASNGYAAVGVNTGSGAFLSRQGLIVTAQHVIRGTLPPNAQKYLQSGIFSDRLADDIPASPSTRIDVLERYTDVTREMTRGLRDELSGLARNERIERHRKALIARCEAKSGRRCDVKQEFDGLHYRLEQMFEIRDVRLVYLPPEGLANFSRIPGLMWPSHAGDFALIRGYVAPDGSAADFSPRNVPYHPRTWLKVAEQGVKEDDSLTVIGFPGPASESPPSGATRRWHTVEELRFFFQDLEPERLKLASAYAELIERATRNDAEAASEYAGTLHSLQALAPYHVLQENALRRADLLHQEAERQALFRAWLAAQDDRRDRQAVVIMDAALTETQHAEMDALTLDTLDRCRPLYAARLLYRWSKSRQKPDVERDAGFQQRDRPALEAALTQMGGRFFAAVDRRILEEAIKTYGTSPSADANFLEQIKTLDLDEAYAKTRLGDLDARLRGLEVPARQLETSSDPFMQLAITLYPGDELRRRQDAERKGRLQRARSVYLQSLSHYTATQGRDLYPETDHSLRISTGAVAGRRLDGAIWIPVTTVDGILVRNTGVGEFNAPPQVLEKIRARDFGSYAAEGQDSVPLAFISSVDAAFGSSGSATLNDRGEFVGIVIAPTADSVLSLWTYLEAARTVHVDSRFMLWLLDRVEGSQQVLQEIKRQ